MRRDGHDTEHPPEGASHRTAGDDGGLLTDGRGQSNVVGVALLVGVTAVAIAALTAGVGTVVETSAVDADVESVVDGLSAAVQPVETNGAGGGEITFAGGTLETVERDVRVLDADGEVLHRQTSAITYRRDGSLRAVALGGAVVRTHDGESRFVRSPPITVAGSGERATLVVGVVDLDGSFSVAASGRTRLRVQTDVRHERTRLGHGQHRVAVETRTPGPWRSAFASRGASVSSRDIDGDGVPSVIGAFDERTAFATVHDVEVTVRD